jgi:hypothetical protein
MRVRDAWACVLASLIGIAGCSDDSGKTSPEEMDAGEALDAAAGADGATDAGPSADASDARVDAATGPIDVSGKAVGGARQPLSDVQVVLLPDRATTTDSEGEFQFEGVETPYDIAVIFRAEVGSDSAVVYRGLTRADPVLEHSVASTSTVREAELSGTIGGGLFDESNPGAFTTAVYFTSSAPDAVTLASSTNGSYALSRSDLTWAGPEPLMGRVHALQYRTDGSGTVTSFSAYGRSSQIAVNDGDRLTDVDVTLDQELTDAAVQGEASVPENHTFSRVYMHLVPSEQISLRVTSDTAPAYSFVTPDLEGAQVMLSASASDSDSVTSTRGLFDPNSDSADLELFPAPEPQTPANNASNVDRGTSFTWKPFEYDVYFVNVRTSSTSSSAPEVSLYTAEPTTTLPDLRAFGFELSSGTQYEWFVRGFAPASMNEAASPTRGELLGSHIGRSANREFTRAGN